MKNTNKLFKVVDRRDSTTYYMTREDAVNATIHDWNLEIQFDNGMTEAAASHMAD